MEHAKRGASALAASDTVTAVEAYTKALIEHPTSPDYFTQRSTAFSRLKPPRHDLALQDADYAVLCGQNRGKRDKIQAAQQRRVVSLYNLGRYADAKFVLDSMKRWRPKDSKPQEMEHNMWSTKIENKLKTGSQEITIKEYPTESLPDEKAMKALLQSQLRTDGTFKLDGEQQDADMTDTSTAEQAPVDQANSTSTTPAAPTTTVPPQKIRHEWYQNNASVIITLYAKGVKKESAEVELEEDNISVSFPHPSDNSSTFTFTLDPLFALIDPSKSKYAVMSTKIELTLTKSVAGQKWANIEGSTPLKKDTPAPSSNDPTKQAILTALHSTSTPSSHSTPSQPTVGPQPTAPSYPTSSATAPKNWDKLAADLTAKKPKSKPKSKSAQDDDSEPEDDASDTYESDTGDAVDGFFKKLYKGADDDTRRAMMKSFQESNGTALSTNWAEVGKGKVEEVKGKDGD